jgi:segregation and condensation protein A
MTDQIFDIIFKSDEITWQGLLLELVKSEQMDPWDIDISELSHKYIAMVKKLQQADLRISGKVLLAAAMLLRIKATRLLEDDVSQFDALLKGEEETLSLDEESHLPPGVNRELYKRLKLLPKAPQPRKRKVSIYDLIEALQKALETKKRRIARIPIVDIEIPEKKFDISKTMEDLLSRIIAHCKEKGKLTFSDIAPKEADKKAKVYSFIPLIFLSNTGNIELQQQEHFGEIDILLRQNQKEIEKELGSSE